VRSSAKLYLLLDSNHCGVLQSKGATYEQQIFSYEARR
jgi:hypothetical protein